MSRPVASLSLDLDNQWSYMKTHGDAGWDRYPSYLDVLVPRVLEVLDALDLTITFFVVGRDASRAENKDALAAISAAGHEIGNHSFDHEPWLQRYERGRLVDEIARAEDAIESVTGVRPRCFRGPGFSVSDNVLRVLAERGYALDASTFPTFLGPLARTYYFLQADLDNEEKEQRKALFGKFRYGFLPLRPYVWDLDAAPNGDHAGQQLLEIPVTTMPWTKLPFHVSYLLYLSGHCAALARLHWRTSLGLCALFRVQPSILLHPLDFLGADDVDALSFFPGMQLSGMVKRERVTSYLRTLGERFEVLPMGEHAKRIRATESALTSRAPRF